MFIFSTCQIGAESVLKREVLQKFPDMRSAFARPGFVSFKTESLPEHFAERSVFARTVAVSLGKIEAESNEHLAAEVWKTAAENSLFVNRVHVFERDPLPVGEQDFEPHIPQELVDIHRHIIQQSPKTKFLGTGANDIFHPAQTGETVLDVVRIDPNHFMVGTHTVTNTMPIHSRYAGGIIPLLSTGTIKLVLPYCPHPNPPPKGEGTQFPSEDIVSRAYLKFHEGFLWSGITLEKGDLCLDIGASPGGCSQFLLQRGVKVLGVDPGEIHPNVLNHPNFTHIRSRIKSAKRSLFRGVRWITADMNVAPNYTLEVLEEIVSSSADSIQGLLFTLKLIRWELADSLPKFRDRIRSWGFSNIRMKQLAFNRQEVMVTGINPRFPAIKQHQF